MIINIVDNCVTTAGRGPWTDHRVEALTANQPSAPHTIHPWHTCHTNKFSKEDRNKWKYKIIKIILKRNVTNKYYYSQQ